MPGGDGYELLRKVRAMDGASGVPAIAVSDGQRRGTATRHTSEIPGVCGQTRGPDKADFYRREYLSKAIAAQRRLPDTLAFFRCCAISADVRSNRSDVYAGSI